MCKGGTILSGADVSKTGAHTQNTGQGLSSCYASRLSVSLPLSLSLSLFALLTTESEFQ